MKRNLDILESNGKFYVLQVMSRNSKGQPAGRVVFKTTNREEAEEIIERHNKPEI